MLSQLEQHDLFWPVMYMTMVDILNVAAISTRWTYATSATAFHRLVYVSHLDVSLARTKNAGARSS